MATKWTDDQQDAIDARGGTLLVSAAAGSGKTAVLVQRVIERITAQDGCDADRLLVVTFTKAAATEMKQRIASRISELLAERPDDLRLQRQKLLLERARISTVHSFCSDLIRENFSQLGVSPTFRIATEDEMLLLCDRAAQETAEEAYATARADGGFRELVELFAGDRDDRRLTDTVRRLYDFVRSHPFPEQWLDEKTRLFEAKGALEKTPWGEILFTYAAEQLQAAEQAVGQTARLAAQDDAIAAAYGSALADDAAQCRFLKRCAEERNWDAMAQALGALSFARLGSLKRGAGSETVKERVQTARKRYKEQLVKLGEYFDRSTAEVQREISAQLPVVRALAELCKQYGNRLDALKKERNLLDFGDLEHFAIALLVRPTENGFERTAAAKELSERFEEVMVDEYQDTNGAQDMIFSAVSRNEENLFLVGDVKQSIYRFRQASPELFLRRRAQYPRYDRKKDEYPAAVILGQNFRSRSGVTGACNFLFRLLMSRSVGDLDYTEEEELVPAAQYPAEEEPSAELQLFDTSQYDGEGEEAEAKWIAQKIRAMVDSGVIVSKNGEQRPAEYRDFCILLRSASKHTAPYAKALAARKIPVWTSAQGGFFAAREISVTLSLLRVIDNPLQDIPLLAVLLSPVCGFSADDAAKLRLRLPKGPLYQALQLGAEEDVRCAGFLSMTARFRRLAATMPSDRLLRCVFEELHMEEMVLAMRDGGAQLANLRLLLEYARTYERAGYRGLSGFIRYIDRLQEQRSDLAPASVLSESANVVRIMSIHHSKGLEFPFVFLADTARKFNTSSQIGDLLIHPELGVGLKRKDPVSGARFSTAAYDAVRLETARDELSEQLRVLYVAVTRAREKLFLLASFDSPEKRLASLAAQQLENGRLLPFDVRSAGSFADWILSALLRHRNGAVLRKLAGAEDQAVLPGSAWKIECSIPHREDFVSAVETDPCAPDKALLERLQAVFAAKPAATALSAVPVKAAISQLAEERERQKHLGERRPRFLTAGGLTPAERGTAMHRFLQFVDYPATRADSAAELARLTTAGFLTAEEGASVDLARIDALFSGALGKRIFAAEKVHREVRFFGEIPASRIAPGLSGEDGEETVLLQGVADCVLEEADHLILIDYKTDRVKTGSELAARYAGQLGFYAEALEKTFGKPVREKLLYSLWLSQTVVLP